MRAPVVVLAALAACSKSEPKPKSRPPSVPDARVVVIDAEPAGLAPHRNAKDLATAFRELVGDDVRAVGVGELHTRIDKASDVRSALARFTDVIVPLVAARASDLVVETWTADPDDKKCGEQATKATQQVEQATQRPEATKSELAMLADATRAAKIAGHAMKLGCADWAKIAPPGKEISIEAMLTIITRELGRIAVEAIAARDAQKSTRRLVLTYGGALHNDLYPVEGVEDWSFGPKVDQASGGHYVELDLVVPEYAEIDQSVAYEPWYPLLPLTGPDHVVIVEKGPRSYAVLLERTK